MKKKKSVTLKGIKATLPGEREIHVAFHNSMFFFKLTRNNGMSLVTTEYCLNADSALAMAKLIQEVAFKEGMKNAKKEMS